MLEFKYPFEAFGTQWVVETNTEIAEALKNSIQNRIEVFDKTYSRFRKDSLVSAIAQKAGKYVFPGDAERLVGLYEGLYKLTEGRVTPLIGDMVSRAGYDAEYSLQPKSQKPVLAWNEAMSWDGLTLTTTQPITLDFGAAGKGYMVDILATLLDEYFEEYVIDASGDLLHKGTSKNIVGLEHPLETGKVIGTVDVQNKSLCASASNRRAWGDGMHHIFDPHKMAPTNEIIATWVIADEAIIADGLATALFFTDAKKLSNKYDFEYVRMHSSGVVEYSQLFEKKLF